MEILSKFRVGVLYVPPLPYPHKNSFINNVGCVGGLNIYHPPVADPTTGMLYASHQRSCLAPSFLVPTPDATYPAIMEPRIVALNAAFSF